MAKITELNNISHASSKSYARKFDPPSREFQLSWQIEHNLKQYEELRTDIIEKLNELHKLESRQDSRRV